MTLLKRYLFSIEGAFPKNCIIFCLLEYRVTHGKHCGGQSIVNWSDGSEANYGTLKGLGTCKVTCNAYAECAGFVSRRSDGICGFWKSGPFQLYDYSGHDCYEKIGAYRS